MPLLFELFFHLLLPLVQFSLGHFGQETFCPLTNLLIHSHLRTNCPSVAVDHGGDRRSEDFKSAGSAPLEMSDDVKRKTAKVIGKGETFKNQITY